ncbi:pyruvate, phosphate dikinase [Desulfoluna butyratoxydans]|uniref:Pyruvate, phosphate dikinase n=1 Tax=Desulfoluna butyratoxydans TaxID=231438 RepID=A0A4U8YNU7_9BACT|nr:pyruvate, phosphate dikinase [Desulfoluna butyratoxydans]VFQ45314.1 pyruvate phosphate dikinase [Desulfoluna butyratoxydans]
MEKYVYSFNGEKTEGDASLMNLLGGKGANLAEMARLGIPVPPGFTITTECCNAFLRSGGSYPHGYTEQLNDALGRLEKNMGLAFGDPDNPLLVSCRSGGRQSMPGMMETVLNVGLTSGTIPGLIKKTGNGRFVYDSYRRLIMMYADVVMEKAEGIEAMNGNGIRNQLEKILAAFKETRNLQNDADLTEDDLKTLCGLFTERVETVLGEKFPDSPEAQLQGAIGAVFKSWNGKRAQSYRRIEQIPDSWGTGVTVQAMVFGNMGDTSATGVAFTRNPATGENTFFGEWLANAQGEDVVAGLRTPAPINDATKRETNKGVTSLEVAMPGAYNELEAIRNTLERHYKEMLDIEFTIQNKRLYMLQCRVGKRTGTASLVMAMEMLEEGLIDEVTAIKRVKPQQLNELLHPIVDPEEESRAECLTEGLPAGPGGAFGHLAFTSDDAVKLAKTHPNVILVREETNPEDIEGMRAASGILTARGGMTSHAALVARGWGKCCIVGAGDITIHPSMNKMQIGDKTFNQGDILTLNGTRGRVYEGKLKMVDATEDTRFQKFMQMADAYRTMGVRANADTREDALVAKSYGAEGIGLFRTEHMFYSAGADDRLFILRKIILSDTEGERKAAVQELEPYVKEEIKETLKAMNGMPVTIRALDPPLHEFVPHSRAKQIELAEALGVDVTEIKRRCEALQESNPMMGHRGVRLGISVPDLTEMQVKAVFEATAELAKDGFHPQPEIMIPVTCDVEELVFVRKIVNTTCEEVARRYGLASIVHKFGTMIEIPRSALRANQMAELSEFFSFGTNDLTQLTYGFSRDDVGEFLPTYLEKKILPADPFQTLDPSGVGELIKIAVERGRKTRPDLKLGICGEHGGDPDSVRFCYKAGLDYVSCSPYRIPIARLAAAHAAIEASEEKK